MRPAVLLLLFLPLCASSQPGGAAYKLSLSSLVDFNLPSVNVMGEFPLGGPWTLQAEGGWILPIDGTGELVYRHVRGYRLRPAVRRYRSDGRRFFEFMYVARVVNMDIEADFVVQNGNGASYFRRGEYDASLQRHDFLVNYGQRKVFPSGIMFEFAFGAGISYRRERYFGYPDFWWFRTNGALRWNPGGSEETLTAAGMFYVNVGYQF